MGAETDDIEFCGWTFKNQIKSPVHSKNPRIKKTNMGFKVSKKRSVVVPGDAVAS